MKKITTLLLTCLVALVAFHARAVNTSDYVIDEGMLIGDVNVDERVNVSDVTTLINMILGFETTNQARADINGDGKVNVSDVTALINIILGTASGGNTGGSVIQMSDFVPNNLSSYADEDYEHKWVDGDVIFIAVDVNFQSTDACKNVYAMVRTGGKWVLKDVNGSNKQGFKTSGGTVCGVYVQHADLANSSYNRIPLNGDVACAYYASNYTVTPKNDKYYIKILNMTLYHDVSRIDVSGAQEGDYFYGSVTHLDALKKVFVHQGSSLNLFETSDQAPVIDIDSNHKGYAYGVWKMGTRVDGWLTLNYTKSNGYSYWWDYGQKQLNVGRNLQSLYSPWQNTWNRDLSMRAYNYGEKENFRANAGGSAVTMHVNVGSNVIFRAYNGDKVDSDGQILSAESSTSGIIDVSASQDQVSIIAHKMGSTTFTIKHKTKDNYTVTYTFNIIVEPTVWIAGSVVENGNIRPMLWRNHQSMARYLRDRNKYKDAKQVIVRGSTAYVMMLKTDESTFPSGIYKATGAHNGGYFDLYQEGIVGCIKQFGSNGSKKYYIHSAPHMWVDKSNNVYYTSSYRENNTTQLDGYINTEVYKNKTKLQTMTCMLVNDLVTDYSGRLYLAGIKSDYQCNGGTYFSMGDATGLFGIIDANNNVTVTPWSHYLFNRFFVKENTVYVNAIGYYKMYGEYPFQAYKNVFLRYTSETGLQLYTGSVSENGFSMGSETQSQTTVTDHRTFILENNKFYYSAYMLTPIMTYQLGASETVEYTAYPSESRPNNIFDVKKGWIGMVLYAGADSPLKVMTSELDSYNSGSEMENSTGATIYDVFLQTSLDD